MTHDRIAVFAKNYAIIFNSLEEIIISGVVDAVPNFWTSYGRIFLIVTSATAELCLVAIVILGIKHQRLYAMFLVLHNDRGCQWWRRIIILLYSANDCDSDNDDSNDTIIWSPYEIEIILVSWWYCMFCINITNSFLNEAVNLNKVLSWDLTLTGNVRNVLLLNLITLKVVSRITV